MPGQTLNSNLDVGQLRFEQQPLGDSQIQPEFQYRQPEFLAPIEDSHFEPAVTVLSMSLQWERHLAQEKRRNRQLSYMVSMLNDQIQQADINYKALKTQYDRLCNAVDSSQAAWALQDPQKTPTLPSAPAFPNLPSDTTSKPASSAMPPPPPPTPKDDQPQGTKRKGDNTCGNPKRVATRNLVLTPYDRPLSPKSLFSPQTPTSMNF
ncbi:hypothetical protein L207DRAFT_632114 [Hyaloscypha variabilis F]|uniref:Uncharacterized protein n=1 Tax=Hyaloscypha variabilis (strain UAMH 11265 / GT02V1 / F) TaxID=1149755 RepID=A0A2J6RUY7_HYAVF|nr:hypothetical protein L207DRAFT_632114 [Hyaloscypha variabilis F]